MARSFLLSLTAAAVAAFAITTAPVALAHQKLILPEPFFLVDGKDAQWKPLAFLEGQKFNTSADFNGYRKQKGYKDLRAFMDDEKLYKVNDDALFDCGYTDPSVESQPIPTTGTIRSTGYTHDGPCEVWLDDVKVMTGDNCHAQFPGKTHKLDYSSCKGSCTLRWYWMGLRFLKNKWSWQVYKECVALSDKPSASGATPTTATTKAPASGSKAPMSATKAPTPAMKTPAPTSMAPAPATKPAATTKAPAPATTTKAPVKDDDDASTAGEGDVTKAPTIPTTIPKCNVKKN